MPTDRALQELLRSSEPWLAEQTILLAVHGSHAYGTARPESDLDLKGVAVPPRDVLFSFQRKWEQSEIGIADHSNSPPQDDIDAVVYEVRKFFRLAAACNPNIIEVLWVHDDDLGLLTPAGERLREARGLFLSKRARHSFHGYAMSQLKRIRTHRRWLLEPPTHMPSRSEFGLPEEARLPPDQLAAAEARVADQLDEWEIDWEAMPAAERFGARAALTRVMAELDLTSDSRWAAAARRVGYAENFIELIRGERRYRSARAEWKQYQGWKRNRNEARAALEAEHGYDTKHAMHLMRLLRMCCEILTDAQVNVRRPDAEELLEIRGGAWTYDRLMNESEAISDQLDEAAVTSTLPDRPDTDLLERLCQEIISEML